MSGKYRICFALSLAAFFFTGAVVFAQEQQGSKSKLYVNGYDFNGSIDSKEILGLRLKARADLYFREKNFASSIKYYEEASRYIPGEADIYFNLGNIYLSRNIYNMSASYFKMAGDRYLSPDNRLKSRKFYYLSIIRYGISLAGLSKTRGNEESSKAAKDVYWKIMGMESVMTNDFPEISGEFSNFNRALYGDVTVNKK